ncbi:MAG: hypothetical protein AAF657_04750 [Acidobacteriota bacterium]
MKKRTKKLNLRSETLRVEEIVVQAVGGYQSQQCNPTDIGPDSICAQCGTGLCGCQGPEWCHSVNGC